MLPVLHAPRAPGTLAAILLLSGCSTSEGFKLPFGLAEANLTTAPPQSDSCPTPQECALELKRLVADPKRDWIGRPQSARAYANGTRLFAYRILRKKLTCEELHLALDDTKTASALLQEAHFEHERLLAADVLRELHGEHSKRCRPRS
jgi:hypothetical protein